MPVTDTQLESLRLPPHSIEAEQSVLGGLLLDQLCGDEGEDGYVDCVNRERHARLLNPPD